MQNPITSHNKRLHERIDAGLQSDIVILGFSKVSDTIRHKKLLSDFENGIGGPLTAE